MKLFQNLPIKRKMLLTNLAISGAVLVVATAALFAFQILNFRANFKRDIATLAAVIANNSTAALAFNDANGAAEVVNSLKANPAVMGACLVRPDGTVLANFGGIDSASALARFPAAGASRLANWHLLYTEPVKLDEKTVGKLYLQANYRRTFMELVYFYGRVIGGVSLGSFVLALFLSGKLGRVITHPLLQLAETARHVGEKQDYSVRAPGASSGDELGRLNGAFNQMLSRIEAQDLALKEGQERYEVAIAGAKDGIWDWNLKTNEVFFSPQWKAIIGYSDHEIENKLSSWEALLHPEDVGPTMAVLKDYLELRCEVYQAEFRMRHKHGHYHWVLARGAARRAENGKPYRMAGSHTDINDRKKAEVEVRAAREKFESLVNSIDGIVWEWNPRHSYFTFISPQSHRLLGYPPARWIGDPEFWRGLIHPEDLERVTKAFAEAVLRRQPYSYEYRMRAADQRVLWIRESGVVLMEHDQPASVRGIFMDITEQKNAATELAKLNEQVAKSQRQAGMAEVATGVLHNVGNVLNSVNVSAILLRDNVKKSQIQNLVKATHLLRDHAGDTTAFLTSDPKGQRLPGFFIKLGDHLAAEQRSWQEELEGLGKNIEHIKEIVAMQQSYARLSGVSEALDAKGLVEDALRINESAFSRHGVTLVRDFQEVPKVIVDKHKVLQILINLMRNAKYAMDDSGKSEKTMTVAIRGGDQGRVWIEVVDTGIGIPPENLARIFQHGFTTKQDGHGFGLHSGANAAREMGGNLTARSDGPGHGATFILELPAARPAETQETLSQHSS